MKKGISLLDVPYEVQQAWVIAHTGKTVGIGQGLLDKYNSIVDNYPEWFVWEHKYKKVPQEVHDAHFKDVYGCSREEYYKPTEIKCGAGLWNEIQTKLKQEESNIEADLYTILKGMDEAEQKRRNEEYKEKKRLKQIWKNHYSKYGLEFRV